MNVLSPTGPKRNQALVLVQVPNTSLVIALAATLLTHFLSGEAQSLAGAVFYVALTIWAYAEITQGINYFRRALGLVVLIYILASLTAVLPQR